MSLMTSDIDLTMLAGARKNPFMMNGHQACFVSGPYKDVDEAGNPIPKCSDDKVCSPCTLVEGQSGATIASWTKKNDINTNGMGQGIMFCVKKGATEKITFDAR